VEAVEPVVAREFQPAEGSELGMEWVTILLDERRVVAGDMRRVLCRDELVGAA
jgi:hypothetical protein